MEAITHDPASFRDPSGFVFRSDGLYYRQVNQQYAGHYDLLMQSGLYQALTEKRLLIPHVEIPPGSAQGPDCYKTLLPEQLPAISYAYEWCFDQLKDAALLTLRVMKIAVEYGMILKDATPFNIQFVKGKPIFIDTLSFEKHDTTQPWIAYRQFCECFLFPLYLEHYLKTDIQKLMAVYLEGIPVDVTARLLPMKSSLNMGVWLHVYLQNNVKEDKPGQTKAGGFDLKKQNHLTEHLQGIITKFSVRDSAPSVWSNYYRETILSKNYLEEKEKVFRLFTEQISCECALDAGANDGYFSRILAETKPFVMAIDFDAQCINNLYRSNKKSNIHNILPLCIDLTNPSPAVGFANKERPAFLQRVKPDLVTALALVHHLVLGKNIPLADVAAFLHRLTARDLVIEFVPLSDPKAQELVKSKNSYHHYDQESFENAFTSLFQITSQQTIPGTGRILYAMKKS